MAIAEGSIEVQASADAAYARFANLESFPSFMRDVIEVRRLDDEHMLWVEEVDGRRQQWHAEVVDARPGERFAWQSTGPFPRHAGTVTFSEQDGRTSVQLQVEVEPEGGPDDRGGGTRAAVEEQVHDALRQFKRLVEGHPHARGELSDTLSAHDSVQGEGRPGPGGGA